MSTRWIAVGGVLSIVLAFPHALLGWPAIAGELVRSGVDPDRVAGIAVGWHFGSVAMTALGLVLLAAARSVPTSAWAFRATLAVGAAYVAFGVGAVLYRSPRPQFLAFVVLGALILGGALRARK